ncbi:50S ribosomal protein L25 [Chloroflexota bacterium]
MKQTELLATTRETLGKKVRFLRRQGITPVHLFGHNVESVALQCDTAQLKLVLAQTGRTRLISLKIDKATSPKNVVIREVQREPRTSELLHVDFYQVSMAEKIRVEVPIVAVGEAPALKSKENFLVQELNSLSIECLPGAIPNRVSLDLASLTEAGQAIHAKDITLDAESTILNNPEQLVARIGARTAEKLVEEEAVVEEEAEAPAEAQLPEEKEPTEGSSSTS